MHWPIHSKIPPEDFRAQGFIINFQERRFKMRRLSLILFLVCFLCTGVLAVDYRGVGNWADPNGWSDGAPPSGAAEVKVRGEETVLTLNTSTGDWGPAQA